MKLEADAGDAAAGDLVGGGGAGSLHRRNGGSREFWQSVSASG